jgi:hypothetical protein
MSTLVTGMNQRVLISKWKHCIMACAITEV